MITSQTCVGGHNELAVLPTHANINFWKRDYYRYINEKAVCVYLRSDEGRPVLSTVMQRYAGKLDEVDLVDFISEACYQDFTVLIKNALKVQMRREPKVGLLALLRIENQAEVPSFSATIPVSSKNSYLRGRQLAALL
jgi:2-hydroxy-3-keto-5-methylthiopentenyl-1-phosphate phosphatase